MAAVHASQEKRAEALAIYQEHGLAAAHNRTGVARSTLRDWAKAEGLDPAQLSVANRERMQAAHETNEVHIGEMRAELRVALLAAALDCTERITAKHVEYMGKDATRKEMDSAPADACRNYAVAAGVFIDKFRLESGESTSRTESLSGDEQRSRVERLADELAARRVKAS